MHHATQPPSPGFDNINQSLRYMNITPITAPVVSCGLVSFTSTENAGICSVIHSQCSCGILWPTSGACSTVCEALLPVRSSVAYHGCAACKAFLPSVICQLTRVLMLSVAFCLTAAHWFLVDIEAYQQNVIKVRADDR